MPVPNPAAAPNSNRGTARLNTAAVDVMIAATVICDRLCAIEEIMPITGNDSFSAFIKAAVTTAEISPPASE